MLVEHHENDEEVLLKYSQQERLFRMMEAGGISKDRALWHYLKHYARDRANKIEQMSPSIQPMRRNKRVTDSNYDEDFLRNYFDEDKS